MAGTPRTPNTSLATLLDQGQCQREELARAVNRIGRLAGMPLTCSGQSVSMWLRGHQPKQQVRAIVVAALSEKLDRPITHEEAGLTPATSSLGTQHRDTVEELIDPGRADMDPSRRGVLAAGVFTAAPAVPVFSTAAAHASEPVSPGKALRSSSVRITRGDDG
ncbi:hypothetical protein AB0H77_04185 [Streptomyces sp. NPDC050844]|uniref:hypothetical protein n=1 Tax=Streptomyces sp. NPDC050844 TaxID=3155790 RepID=UPI0033DC91B5